MVIRAKPSNLKNKAVGKVVWKSVDYLTAQQDFLKQFSDIDDLVLLDEESNERKVKAIQHHIWKTRAALARILWSHEVFIGIDVIDRLIFDLLLLGKGSDLVSEFFAVIQKKGLHREGFVLYPLHSFGLLGFGFLDLFEKASVNMILGETGLAITAQTNSEERTVDFLNEVKNAFGIKQNVPLDLVEHFMRSRRLHWLANNPLLAVRVRSFSGTYYENQFIYMLKLRLSTALIMMLSTLEDPPAADNVWRLGSTARVNNFQTLDIKHYLTFETPIGKRVNLSAYCVPMHAAPLELADLSDLFVEIDPRYWMKTRANIRLKKLNIAMSQIERGYLNHVILGSNKLVQGRVYRKLLISIDAFRRSFSARTRHSEATISLAIAFESLLTDAYSQGVAHRLVRRVQLCLRGVPGTLCYQKVVGDLYDHRSDIVHSGSAKPFGDMAVAHRVYVLCLQHVVSRLPNLPNESAKPIGDILGD